MNTPTPLTEKKESKLRAVLAECQRGDYLDNNFTHRDLEEMFATIDALRTGLAYVFQTADFHSYELGVHNGSSNTYTQTKGYICFGCNATAESHWPRWEVNFLHAADCRYVAAINAAGLTLKSTERA